MEPASIKLAKLPPPTMNKEAMMSEPENIVKSPVNSSFSSMRKEILLNRIKELLEEVSGNDMSGINPAMSFLEIGMDSLLLTQVAMVFKKAFNVPVTFRQMNEDLKTPALLVDYLDLHMPVNAIATHQEMQSLAVNPSAAGQLNAAAGDMNLQLLAQQLQMLSGQMALMQNAMKQNAPVSPVLQSKNTDSQFKTVSPLPELSPEEAIEISKPFGAAARIEKVKTELDAKQALFLSDLIASYTRKTASSKAYTQNNRARMSDPRVVSGFKPLTKEIVYPIVVHKSLGSHLWDLDGNKYIDVLNGFGSSMLGHQHPRVKAAVLEQVEKGYEVGPQHELAGDVTDLVCELTGHERAALCSTGSEAVLGAMRIARTVTGKSLIVAFSGSYHGIVDEVIVRGSKQLKTYPAASGIMPEAVQNMLILEYGTEDSLRIIKERANDIAAVLVEPVQSRRPEFVPIAFLKQLRTITNEQGIALIFDEVITGFRMHPGGAQAMFGVKADIASYGKVVASGIPIGVIAGKKEYMDALDGGYWRYGDDSFPEIGVTYFAGTFVRHPLALASAKAALSYMKEKGPGLQESINAKAEILAKDLNAYFEQHGYPFYIAQFGSLWKLKFKTEIPYSELLFTLMRERGIHIWDGFPCFFTEAHTDSELQQIISCMKECIGLMTDAGFFNSTTARHSKADDTPAEINAMNPPIPGARLGRNQNGEPAWFISDPQSPGKYLQIHTHSE